MIGVNSRKILATWLVFYMAASSVDCNPYCVACRSSHVTCRTRHDSRETCRSGCLNKKLCPNVDDLCLATMVKTRSGLNAMFADCFARPPYSGDTNYTSRCAGRELNGTITCLCSGNGCNRKLVRELKMAPKQGIQPRAGSESVWRDDRPRGEATMELSARDPTFVCIALLVLLILLLLIVCGVKQRKINALVADAQSGRGSAINRHQEEPRFILQCQLGRGHWGVVWKASLDGEVVSVKLFSSCAAGEYKNERDFFSCSRIHHTNVVSFIAAGEGALRGFSGRQRWVITEYCQQGSLQEYLKSHVLSWNQTLVFLHGISSGLSFLHAASLPEDNTAKVPFAHRDLKSSNILVKESGTCALADFDSATALDRSLAVTNNQSFQVGTYRYMSPEELDASVNLDVPDAFKQMDVYSMSLVMWEVTSRCAVTGLCRAYEPPFQLAVGDLEPSLDVMRRVVVQENQRPPLDERWRLSQGLQIICDTMQECWDSDPEARLTAGCTKLRLAALMSEQPQLRFARACEPHYREHLERP